MNECGLRMVPETSDPKGEDGVGGGCVPQVAIALINTATRENKE